MKRTAFVVGMGLIGGSISLAIKRDQDIHLVGYDISAEQLHMAKALGVIDEAASSLEEGAQAADFIILAVPVSKTIELIEQLSTIPLKQGVIVTDVGSTKQDIAAAADNHFGDNVCFIGGHPMAGSHKSGVEAAKAHLFENAFYLLAPGKNSEPRHIIALQNLLKGTKARFLQMEPQQHDKLAGTVSHFPHIIAASLVHQLKKLEKTDPEVAQLAAGGFRDITRIASASPVMWRDVLLHNKEEMLRLFAEWQIEMDSVKEMVERCDGKAIHAYFQEAKAFREELPQREKGAIPAFYDLFVDVPDHPGVISDVTRILANKEISITNIRILETREDIMGVLRLSFRSEDDRVYAQEELKRHMYETYTI
ncbi:prephenate dehydrogenase [Shouchella clausii]|uniref:Prephenate dehydrogenase n=4 Tax=Shouchella TaxID=2893057 RepID=Q5WGR8_SHOC1|nr:MULTISPECIES: prephenate dehydrogenase [Shouchella]MCM3312677.1 prephenate dehydrogenase [Psychrobacillus sp. MER TA 17]ALA50910.1 Prephenate dehydrogenase [Shouchella clausii]KKI85748.1 prephenate dehydrogenase [Shouchella clausii]MBU3231717.1 prephenate dehydrogenase [Shouchella clausii]MBU3264999.1 prephenate dehydrogenase [Shouchella clausii]